MESSIIITDISWERIFLTINFKVCKKPFKVEYHQIGLYNRNLNKFIVLTPEVIDKKNDEFAFTINITAIDNREFLANGDWRIGYFEDEFFVNALVDYDLAYRFPDLSRIFRYGKGKIYAYTVNFDLTSKNDDIYFLMRSYFMKKNEKWLKRNYFEEGKYTHQIMNRLMFKYKTILLNFAYKFFSIFYPKTGKNVLFMSETNPFINGNLEALDNKMKELKWDKEYNVSYSFRRAVGNNKSIFSWLKIINKIAKQDYIFLDNYAPLFNFINVNKKTTLIQLWHAGGGFKAVGYCRFGKDGSPFPSMSVHKKYKYGFVGSEKLIKVFEEVWGIDKESIYPYGMPRLDNFFDNEKINNIKKDFYEKYPNFKGKKIILFAPTYRGVGQSKAYYDFTKLDFERIFNFCKDEYVFLLKLHPFILTKPHIPLEYIERIYDISDYPNINDLYFVTDIFITDYSSSYYEFAMLKKPMLFYTYDRQIYELARGVYCDIKETAPGKVCDTFDELMNSLENKDYDLEKTLKYAKEQFGDYKGNASEKILRKVLKGEEYEEK